MMASALEIRDVKLVCLRPWPFVTQDYSVRVLLQEVPGAETRLHVGRGLASQGSWRRKNASR
jgi:hypothetical protein